MTSDEPTSRSHPPVSDDVAALAHALRNVEWRCDEVAHGMPSGRIDPGRVAELAEAMEHTAQQLRVYLVRRLGDVIVDDAGDAGGR